jgi:hypothetical protein
LDPATSADSDDEKLIMLKCAQHTTLTRMLAKPAVRAAAAVQCANILEEFWTAAPGMLHEHSICLQSLNIQNTFGVSCTFYALKAAVHVVQTCR